MPKLYEYLGIAIYFWSREHSPIHVHGKHAGRTRKAEIFFFGGQVETIKFSGEILEGGKESDFEEFVRAHAIDIANKWNDYFVMRKNITPEIITRKI